MSAVPKPKLTAAEYLAIERAAEFKSEFYQGEMFAMSGASFEHTGIKDNIAGELRPRLRGTSCRALTSDLRVLVSANGLYTYLDVLVVCGEPQFTDDTFDTLTNPRVIFEVLSPSTERYDRGTKFDLYQPIPSLMEYLLVAQDEVAVEQYVRQPDGRWTRHRYTDPAGEVELPSLNVRLPLAEVYRDVPLPDPGSAQTPPRPGG